jgi:hypothetical protein
MTYSVRMALRTVGVSVLLCLATAQIGTPTWAQSAANIIDEADAAHQAMAQDIRSFTVETEGETNRYERSEENGRYIYRISNASGPASADDMPVMGFLDESYLQGLKEEAVYEGTESIDGVATHVLFVEDPSRLESYASMEGQEFQGLESMRFYLRTDNLMPARFLFKAVLPEDAMEGAPFQVGPGPITFQVDFRDYRTIDGLVYPFVTEMRNDMMEQMPEEQRRQMEQMRAQMEAQMEQMPPEQRQMMEERMGEQFAQMQAMMSGEPVRTTVTNVTVNE